MAKQSRARSERYKIREMELEYEQAMNRERLLLEAFARDPELKYFVGMIGGATLAYVSSVIGGAGGKVPKDQGMVVESEEKAKILKEKKAEPLSPFDFLGYTAPIPVVTPNMRKHIDAGVLPEPKSIASIANPLEFMSSLLTLGSAGFAGFCMMMLIIKGLFGDQGMSEVLKGIGEIVPL